MVATRATVRTQPKRAGGAARRTVAAALGGITVLAAVGAAATTVTPVAGATTQHGTGSAPVRATATAFGGSASVTGALAAFYRPPTPLRYAPAGSVIRSAAVSNQGLPPGAHAYRVLYHSTAASGGDLAESGVVVVPGGTPPPGGFPIVSWAHGTTGVASGCAPSVDGTASIPYLDSLVASREIVVATDYRGLGAPGQHPYLVGTSEGEDVLDAARAARALVGGRASNAVAVLGYSQGGQAALFAGELAATYAPELAVAGVAAVAPVTSVLELAPTGDGLPPSGQSAFTAMVLFAWARHYRTFGLASVLTPAGLADLPAVTNSCVDGVASLYDAVPPAHFFLPRWEQDPAVQAANRANSPGTAPTPAPILVVQGTADEVVPFHRTTSFVDDDLCRSQYDEVDYVAVQGAGHSQALDVSSSTVTRWIRARFSGGPMADSCTKPGLGIHDPA